MTVRLTVASGLVLALVTAGSTRAIAQKPPARHEMRGMVLKVDVAQKTVVVSHDAVPDVMPAMTMPFEVREVRQLNGLVPGTIVTFTLVVDKSAAHIEQLRVVRYQSVEQDPLTARRLRLLQEMARASAKPLDVGREVPDFTLTDQRRMVCAKPSRRGLRRNLRRLAHAQQRMASAIRRMEGTSKARVHGRADDLARRQSRADQSSR